MRRPNLFIVGAAKSGTSSLAAYLSQHPEIYLSPIKEPFYYVEGSGYEDWAEYLSLFAGRKERFLCDASTGYLFEESAPLRIKKDHPDAKIIIILRNPVDMVQSYWRYMQLDGNESLSFSEAISDGQRAHRKTEEFKKNCKNWWCSYLYIERAMYYEQVKRYIDIFGKDDVRIFIFEEFISNIGKVLDDICLFLNIGLYGFDYSAVVNRGGMVRYKWLRDKIYNREYPLLRRVVAPKYRSRVRSFVREVNKIKNNNNAGSEVIDKEYLSGLFRRDVERLCELLGRNSIWEDYSG